MSSKSTDIKISKGGNLPKDQDEADNLSESEIIDNTNDSDEEISEKEEEQVEEVDEQVEEDDNLDDDNEIEDEDESEEEEDDDEGGEDLEEDDGCLYNFKKKKSTKDTEDDNFDDDYFFDEETGTNTILYVDPDDRITKPIMTKFERVRLLGDRTRQLSLGAKPMVKNISNLSPKEIAKMELSLGMMPLNVDRQLPNGRIERWKSSELKIVN